MRRSARLAWPAARAAIWAFRAFREARRTLRAGGVEQLSLPTPPAVTARAGRAVYAVLRLCDGTCLERAVVLQRWHAAHGRPLDVVIGVRPGERFEAHAWLDGQPDRDARAFRELMRLPAP